MGLAGAGGAWEAEAGTWQVSSLGRGEFEGGVRAGFEGEGAGAGAGLVEEVPGFVVLGVEAAVAAGGGIEGDGEASADFGNGDDVPGVFADDVEGEEVDFESGIGFAAGQGAAGVDLVEAVASLFAAGFNLNAPEGVAVVDDGIVGAGAAEGVGAEQAVGGGAEVEDHFGDISDGFGRQGSGHRSSCCNPGKMLLFGTR